jgi:predicted amidohydrolase YtcJ
LSANPLEVAPAELPGLQVLKTVVGGEVVFSRP